MISKKLEEILNYNKLFKEFLEEDVEKFKTRCAESNEFGCWDIELLDTLEKDKNNEEPGGRWKLSKIK